MSSATARDATGGPPPPDAVARLVGFGRFLRGEGFPVGPGRVLTFVRSAAVLSPIEREELYWAARASLISRHDLIEPFDRAFEAYFGGEPAGGREILVPDPVASPRARREPDGPGGLEETAVSASTSGPADEDEEAEERSAIRIVAADTETLRSRSFEALSEEERARTAAMIRRIAVRAARRPTRRLRPAAKGNRFDLRRTLRRSLRTEGEPFRRAWRGRRSRIRPLVLILDVSGSMGPFARALLQFSFAAMAAGGRVEVFCFGTQLTRVTRSLRTKDPDRALRDIGRIVRDWEGGTRIGDSLKELLEGWSQRTALRGAVVVLCSDGLERGDPDLLRAQMARLSRLAHRVVWVNPLKGSPRYEPLARGMVGALPFVDEFLPGHNLQSLEELARAVAR